MATWSVEVNANPVTTGEFVLDESLLDSATDKLASDDRWVTIPTLQVISVSVRRGGSEGFRAYDAGECVVVLDNSSGNFDPDNPYSPYMMRSRRLITQGTGIRVRATGTSAATVFTGRIEEPKVGGNWAAPTASWSCTDLFADLGKIDVPDQVSAKGAGDSSSVRANWLLEQARIPTGKRSVQAAGRLCLGTTGGGTVRSALEQVAAGEAGRFLVTRDGVVKLTWHDAEYSKPVKIAYENTGSSPKYVSIQTSPGIVGIINAATVKRIQPKVRNEETGQYEEGPELPEAGDIDWDSVALYGQRSTTVEVVLQGDADVQELAKFLANRRSNPTPRLATLVSVPLEAMTNAQAQTVLEIELGDLITLVSHTIDGRELTFTATVESIAFDHDSPLSRVTFTTAPSDTFGLFGSASWFMTDSSLLGGTAILAPY